MLGALLSGVFLALGHHLFYQSLAGTTASSADYSILGTSISRQETNIAIGTAFAFLVKAALVFAISVAYIQACWRAARTNSSITTLAGLDAIFSALNNLHTLLNLPAWIRFPGLLFIATSAWLIPIASIVTPATLSIANGRVVPDPTSLHAVPNLDFRTLNFVADLQPQQPFFTGNGIYVYDGPSQDLLRAASAVMAEGNVLPILPPQPNSSWTLQFDGPSLKCENFNDTMRSRMQRDFATFIRQGQNCLGLYTFMAWFPELGFGEKLNLTGTPFLVEYTNGSLMFSEGSIATTSQSYLDVADLPLTMNVFAASPSLVQHYEQGAIMEYCEHHAQNGSDKQPPPDWIDGTMLQCQLFNASYTVGFNYTDGKQTIDVDTELIDQNPLPSFDTVYGPNMNLTHPICPALEFTQIGHTEAPSDVQCTVNPDVIRALSYQAIMDAFTSNIGGSISWMAGGNVQTLSDIVKTSLVRTQEFAALGVNGEAQATKALSLKQALAEYNTTSVQGLVNAYTTGPNLTLADALEEMFQNLTVSLMSVPSLQPNTSSETAPPLTNVTFPTYHNVYVYSKWKLWTAYGAAILVALLVVFIGIIAMVLSGASYSNNFSTIFRAAKGAELNVLIEDEDLDGKDPLSKDLAKAQVSLRNNTPLDEDDTPSTHGSPPSAQKRPTTRSRRLN